MPKMDQREHYRGKLARAAKRAIDRDRDRRAVPKRLRFAARSLIVDLRHEAQRSAVRRRTHAIATLIAMGVHRLR